jgi:hypothetical protein
MRLITIPDLHGKTVWRQIDPAAYDRLVFLGDYVDDRDGRVSDQQMLQNLRGILDLKARFPEKVVLLLGNHDVHYRDYPHFRSSGFRESMREALREIFRRDDFQIAFQVENYLFTHAGVSAEWWAWTRRRAPWLDESAGAPMADRLNALFRSPESHRLHTISYLRQGPHPLGGPTWADFEETHDDPLPGHHQVVGHTPQPRIRTFGDATKSITYTDVLRTQTAFWEKDFGSAESRLTAG